ncbi:MAG: YcxB family protein [Bacteroidia bacterium]|nr:YcxB family protein [Bacteroidia bacterium]
MTQPLTVTFYFDHDDWLAYQHYYADNSKAVRRSRTYFRWILPFTLFGLTAVLFRNEPIIAAVLVATGVILFVTYPKRIRKDYEKRLRKRLKKDDSESLFGHREMIMHEDYFIVKTEISEVKTQWSGIKRMEENEDYIFLFESSLTAHIIPKHKIGSPLPQLTEFLGTRFPS